MALLFGSLPFSRDTIGYTLSIRPLRGALYMFVLLGVSCRSEAPRADGGLTPDGDVADRSDANFEIVPPDPVTLPQLTPCPTEWATVIDEGGTSVCEPTLLTMPRDCPDGTSTWPGQPTCASVGSDCPIDEYATDLPASTVYVRAGSVGGNGSRARPFGNITEALARAASGGFIALARGTYAEAVIVPTGVTIRGHCTTTTIVRAPDAGRPDAVITMAGNNSVIRDLQVDATGREGIVLQAGVAGTLDGVFIRWAAGRAVHARESAVLTARNLVLRDTGPGFIPKGASFVGVLHLERNAAARIHMAAIVGGDESGVVLEDNASLDLEDCVVSRQAAHGVVAVNGATVRVARSLVSFNGELGIGGFNVGRVELTEVVIRENGAGIALEGGSLDGRRLRIEDNESNGVLVAAALDDTHGQFLLEDVVSRRNRGAGIFSDGVQEVRIQRALATGNHRVGILVIGRVDVAASALLEDIVSADTQPEEDSLSNGRGLQIEHWVEGEVRRVRLERNHEAALAVLGDPRAHISIEDLVIVDTRSQASDQQFGRGISIQNGVTLVVTRAQIERSRQYAITTASVDAVAGEGGSFTLMDVVIEDTLEAQCSTLCSDSAAGIGIGVGSGGSASASRFAVRRSALCGVHVGRGGSVDLRDGEVSGGPIGACVQEPGYDVARLSDNVRYVMNESNLDSTVLPSPAPLSPLGQ